METRRHIFTRSELETLADTNPRALVDIVLVLQEQVLQLEERVRRLEARLNQDSHNSHQPPASQGYAKPAPKSLRQKSDRPSGGQSGHPGHTLKAVSRPDQLVPHGLTHCPQGHVLAHAPVWRLEKRQVFDLPVQSLEVVEHQAEVKYCHSCTQEVTAPFPAWVDSPVQYGPHFLGFLVYLRDQQLLPLERIRQIAQDLFGQNISEATIQQAVATTAERLEPFDQALQQAIIQASQLHADETGLRVNGLLHWLHVACTPKLTWYGVHRQRGQVAIDDFFLLAQFKGRLIHDGFVPYWDYGSSHALCNAHHLRELVFCAEEENQAWAARLKDLLLRMLVYRQKHGRVPAFLAKRWIRRYRKILAYAHAPLRSKARPLRHRLKVHEPYVLAFLHDPNIPFTNNQAEQDLRMMKVQQKISGCFRTLLGATHFAKVRSYLSTMRKQGHSLWDALTAALQARPFLPAIA